MRRGGIMREAEESKWVVGVVVGVFRERER